ncbi:hypothetical protein QN277_011964 [Acacia crassicarpa]|uniref:Uncharacterized protein n=1 Tax=Acacia crassicarpa TaxID=499986 RepID=A0AAE1MZJ4_9FABA|nr:hypothetical protein QN277_011964 [Acacia crassicarpa]
MEHQSDNTLKIHESCKIGPPCETELSSEPLTFFDVLWFKLHPSERLYFYSFPSHANSFFFDTLIPKLKRSLSLTLDHFLPLAGKVIWPSNSQKPFLLYTPGDGVSLVIAETDADFNYLSGNGAREASELRPLVPSLDTTDSFASVIALQVTLFQNVGFCIGLSSHHAVLDGKSSTMFMKAWAHICRAGTQEPPSLLPEELHPFLDRTVIKDPNGLDIMYLNGWRFMSEAVGSHERSLKLLPSTTSPQCVNQMSLATFELNPNDLEKIKRRVISLWEKVHHEEEPVNLSTFVLASAFVFACTAKAITGNEESRNNNSTDISFGFSVDCRSRLNPQVNPNYVGNCVFPCMINIVAEDIVKEEGMVIMAKKLKSEIRRFLEKRSVLNEAEALIGKWKSMASNRTRGIALGGFYRFGVYKTDFGWGKPVKVEIATVDTNGLVTMAETREGNGGIEFGLLLYKHELDLFASSFRDAISGL